MIEKMQEKSDGNGGGANEETALVPFAPENVNQAWRLAGTLAKSQLVPRALQAKPHDILVTLITGRELGLSPMQSVRGMHVIEGKAVMSADTMAGLVMSHSDVCEYLRLVESTEKLALYETKRKGAPEPVRLAFTIEDAARAGLTGKDNWKKYPAAMLRARALSSICRAVYPDFVAGVYEPDEAREFNRAEPSAELKAQDGGKLSRMTERMRRGARVVEATVSPAPSTTAVEPVPPNVDPETGEELNDPAELFAEDAPEAAFEAKKERMKADLAKAAAPNLADF